MRFSNMRSAPLALAMLVTAAMPAHAQSASDDAGDDGWQFAVTPYLWLPTINADLRFDVPADGGGGGGTAISSEIGPNDYFSNLDGAFLAAVQARRGRWSINADAVYLSVDSEGSRVRTVNGSGGALEVPRQANLDTSTDVKGAAVTLTAGYAIVDSDMTQFEVLAGARYFGLEAELDWQLERTLTGPGVTFARDGQANADVDLYDAIIGWRGKRWLGTGKHWYANYYADVGTGDSNLTWQAMAGVGYAFRRTDLQLAYRHLAYEGGDQLVQDLSFSGPLLGLTFRF